MTRTILVLSMLAAVTASGHQRVFRAATELVSISVSVKRGNAPVATLTAGDFKLFDNDVAQTIEALSIESIPLDVTLMMDTSGSTAGSLDRMKRDVSTIAGMLRPQDRVRLLTIGLTVETPLPWQPARKDIALTMEAVPGISLVYDALAVALAYEPEQGRRHLVVAMTDGQDCGSVVDGPRLVEMSGRSEAVLHWVWVSNSADSPDFSVPAWCTPRDGGIVEYVGKAAEQTGGAKHRARFGDPAVKAFAQILDEFRRSYVLHYAPRGVAGRGWHRVRVEVPGRSEYTIRSRPGYFGG